MNGEAKLTSQPTRFEVVDIGGIPCLRDLSTGRFMNVDGSPLTLTLPSAIPPVPSPIATTSATTGPSDNGQKRARLVFYPPGVELVLSDVREVISNKRGTESRLNTTTLPSITATLPSATLLTPTPTSMPSQIVRRFDGRTLSKVEQQRQDVLDKLLASPPHTWVFATDGSCAKNPGPCGAGMIACIPSSQIGCSPNRMHSIANATVCGDEKLGTWLEQRLALGPGTNNIAEVSGIELALDEVLRRLKVNSIALCTGDEHKGGSAEEKEKVQVLIFTDSQYAIGSLTKNWKAKANIELLARVKAKWLIVQQVTTASLEFSKGHIGICLNELADRLADSAMQRSRMMKVGDKPILFSS